MKIEFVKTIALQETSKRRRVPVGKFGKLGERRQSLLDCFLAFDVLEEEALVRDESSFLCSQEENRISNKEERRREKRMREEGRDIEKDRHNVGLQPFLLQLFDLLFVPLIVVLHLDVRGSWNYGFLLHTM